MSGGERRWRLGVDVGGTFTDVAVLDATSKELQVFKVPTTPDDPSVGVLNGLRLVAEQVAGFVVADIDHFLHGTTITTNALIQRTYAPCALLVTEGHRGSVQVQDQQRRGNLFDLHAGHPTPIVDESAVFEVPERIAADGTLVADLDTERVEQIADRIAQAGLQSAAVCLLFSFVNPTHEQEVGHILEKRVPGIRLSLSSEILPRIREWPRISTLLLNASLEPLLVDYVERLGASLEAQGLEWPRLFLMESNGGVMPFSAVSSGRAVHTLLSGPAAAVQGAVSMVRVAAGETVITLDIGGTSADIAVVGPDGAMEVTEGQLVGNDIYVPTLDVSTIGAGGGTTAQIGSGGRLLVGPESAGADPGPACYGRGGTLPTTTDADLLLGRLDPDYYLGGRMPLRPDLAEEAVRRAVAEPLGMSVTEAAAAILQINDVHMADAIRVVASTRAIDLASTALIACGGAGPLHAVGVAEELGMSQVAVPLQPGAFSAVGLLCSDVVQDFVQTQITPLVDDSRAVIRQRFADLQDRARRALVAQGFPEADISYHLEADARYTGQGFELRLAVPPGPAGDPVPLAESFNVLHKATYGHDAREETVEIVSYRTRAVVAMPRHEPVPLEPRAATAGPKPRTRRAWIGDKWLDVDVYNRADLSPGDRFSGPAIVEQPDTTTLVPGGWTATCDPYGTLDLRRSP